MKAYSEDLRRLIVNAYDRKEGSQRQLAARFHVSLAFVQKLLRQRRETGSIKTKEHGGGHQPIMNNQMLEVVAEIVRWQPETTLEELCEAVEGSFNVSVSLSTMCRALQQMGLARKPSKIRRYMRRRRAGMVEFRFTPNDIQYVE
jgi:transposase